MKFLLLSTLIFSFFIPSNSQLIDITVCTDNSCKTNCVFWTASNGDCSVCRNSQCSITNPSAKIQNMNSITFYTDTKCLNQNIVSGTSSIPITLDNSCHLLHDNNMNIIGSYSASNKSALIGGIIGGVIFIIFIIMCISCFCCCKKRQIEPPQVNAIIIDEKRVEPVLPRPLSGYGYTYNTQNENVISQPQQYPQPQYVYETYAQQPYPQQPYPQQPYPQQPYAQQPYAQQQYAQQSYYPPPAPSAPHAPPSAPYEYPQKYV
jgi:hypothetical protein